MGTRKLIRQGTTLLGRRAPNDSRLLGAFYYETAGRALKDERLGTEVLPLSRF